MDELILGIYLGSAGSPYLPFILSLITHHILHHRQYLCAEVFRSTQVFTLTILVALRPE
jgi:hypothetical protein